MLCCNKRCAARVQRRYASLGSGRASHPSRKTPASSADTAIEPECGWGSLSGDVLTMLGAHLGLRDRLAAALTCRHWRAQLTRGVTHTELRVSDIDCDAATSRGAQGGAGGSEGEGEGEEGEAEEEASDGSGGTRRSGAAVTAGVLASVPPLLPQVRSLRLCVAERCHDPGMLRRCLLALGAWGELRRLQVEWEPVELPPLPPPQPPLPPRQSFKLRRRYLPAPPPPDPPPTHLSSACLGALGLLTRLQSLSVTARFEGSDDSCTGLETGLRWLSSLEGLTSLELLRAPPVAGRGEGGPRRYWLGDDGQPRLPWNARDADLAALTRLRSLRGDAALLSPPLLAALPPQRLTSLTLERLSLYNYAQQDAERWQDWALHYDVEKLAAALARLTSLRALTINCCAVGHAGQCGWNFTMLLEGIAKLTQAQLNLQAEASAAAAAGGELQQQPAQAQRHRRRRNKTRESQRPSTSPDLNPAPSRASNNGASIEDGAALGPVAVHLVCRGEARFEGTTGHTGPDPDPWVSGGARTPQAKLDLDSDIIAKLSQVVGLVHLELSFSEGGVDDLGRLSQLTSLTTLCLRFAPACRISLDATDMRRLLGSCSRLACLALHLPASCLTAEAMGALPLASGLRDLDLAAHAEVRHVPCSDSVVRARLLARVQSAQRGSGRGRAGAGAGAGSCSGGAAGAAGAGAAAAPVEEAVTAEEAEEAVGQGEAAIEVAGPAEAAVGAALPVLLLLRGLFQALGDTYAVWRELQAQQQQQQQPPQQPQPQQGQAPPAEQEQEPAPPQQEPQEQPGHAPGLPPQEAPAPAEQDPAAAPDGGAPEGGAPGGDAANGGAAEGGAPDGGAPDGGVPSVPLRVLQALSSSPGHLTASAATAAALAAAALAAGAAAADPAQREPVPAVPLQELSREQLGVLRSLVTREEALTGPAFVLDRWAPAGLERLRLRGFAGLALSSPSMSGGGGGGGGAGSSSRRAPVYMSNGDEAVASAGAGAHQGLTSRAGRGGGARRLRLPQLRVVEVVLPEGFRVEAAQASWRAIEEWARGDVGRAPRLGRAVITVEGES